QPRRVEAARPLRSAGPRELRTAREYVRFTINWGARDGATKQRLLAHVCRRGGIPGDRIGVIEVDGSSSSFHVDSSFAGAFAARARTPDRRDPHLIIRRAAAGDR